MPQVRGASAGAKAGRFAQVPQQGAIPQLPPVTPTPLRSAQQRFTGHPVTLDFQGADLRTVLRTFADISGLNIVIDQSVQGAVDVSLHEVPWDQALDIILRDHKLGYSVEGTIVRIAPLTVLADEEAQRRKLIEERALAGELEVLTRPLSYAKAAELTPLLTRTALSARGDIQIDARTNTIIIRDLPARLQGAAQLIDTLDRPQPQVEIEARIVTTTRDFARRIGVQWGMNGRAAQDIGNTTNLAFPNQIALGGRTGGVQGPPGSAADNASTAVNLGISHGEQRHRAGAWIGQRRAEPRRGAVGAGGIGQRPHSLDAAGLDAEQRAGRNHAGRAGAHPDRREQHRDGVVP